MDSRAIRLIAILTVFLAAAMQDAAWARPPIWQTAAVPAEFQSASAPAWVEPAPVLPGLTPLDEVLDGLELGNPFWLDGSGAEDDRAWFDADWAGSGAPEPWDVPALFARVGGWLGGLARRLGMADGESGGAAGGIADALSLYENAQVQKFMRLYLDSHREAFMLGLDRAGEYLPMIQEVLEREGLPVELAYLAIVESNLNPRAVSPKRAAGLWQFMEDTAVHFGLRVEPWYDERLDPVLSTEAAARMLRYLHRKYGNWEIVLAAYNAGEGRVNRALRNTRLSGEEDFWSLALPLQTRRYVPSFMAVALIYNDLEAHGFAPFQPEAFLSNEVARGPYYTTLREIARRTGMSLALLTELNPAWRQGLIPSIHEGDVLLRLPRGGRKRVEGVLKAGAFEAPRMVTHRVSRGETLSAIAERYGVDIVTVLAANRIPNRNHLRRGRELLIPLPSKLGIAAERGGKT